MFRQVPAQVEPETWVLAFRKTTPWWWIRLLAPGRYKHVSAFAWVPEYGIWVWFNVALLGTRIVLLRDGEEATNWLTSQTIDCDLVRIKRRQRLGRAPMIAPFYCVSAVKHLIGLPSGALLPSRFYRDVLANGGELIDGRAGATDAVAPTDCVTA